MQCVLFIKIDAFANKKYNYSKARNTACVEDEDRVNKRSNCFRDLEYLSSPYTHETRQVLSYKLSLSPLSLELLARSHW